MDYAKAAADVLKCIGGKENVISAAHCATRLRLVIADNKKVVKAALEDVTGVQGVFEAQGQLQIIFGTGTVNKVYEEFIAQSGALGKGVAIRPTGNQVVAPCDGTVSAVMGHAVGLTLDNGVELLIHVGIDTVNLNGQHYTGHVTQDQRVKAGDVLLEFDSAAIIAAGYPIITPVLVTNSDDYAAVEVTLGKTEAGQGTLLTIKR